MNKAAFIKHLHLHLFYIYPAYIRNNANMTPLFLIINNKCADQCPCCRWTRRITNVSRTESSRDLLVRRIQRIHNCDTVNIMEMRDIRGSAKRCYQNINAISASSLPRRSRCREVSKRADRYLSRSRPIYNTRNEEDFLRPSYGSERLFPCRYRPWCRDCFFIFLARTCSQLCAFIILA